MRPVRDVRAGGAPSGQWETTRERRRAWLRAALGDWDAQDHEEFGRLLEKFNLSIDKIVQECQAEREAGAAGPVSGAGG